jgi:hypothetical protein
MYQYRARPRNAAKAISAKRRGCDDAELSKVQEKGARAVDKGNADTWASRLAERLVCELFEPLGIPMRRQMERGTSGTEMDAVYGQIQGDCPMRVQLCAPPGMFYRLACGLLGGEPESAEEVRESATEFFNVLCGRFVSEICGAAHIKAHFDPPTYQAACEALEQETEETLNTLYFVTEEKEQAEFSWSQNSMDELLRRSGLQ